MLLHGLLDAIIDGVDRWHRTVGSLEAADVDVLCSLIIDPKNALEHVLGDAFDPSGLLRNRPDGAILLVGAPTCGMARLAALEAGALFERESGFRALRRAVLAAAVAAARFGPFSLWCSAGLRRHLLGSPLLPLAGACLLVHHGNEIFSAHLVEVLLLLVLSPVVVLINGVDW